MNVGREAQALVKKYGDKPLLDVLSGLVECNGPLLQIYRSYTRSSVRPSRRSTRFYAFLIAGTGVPAILRFTEPRKFQVVK